MLCFLIKYEFSKLCYPKNRSKEKKKINRERICQHMTLHKIGFDLKFAIFKYINSEKSQNIKRANDAFSIRRSFRSFDKNHRSQK